MNPIFTTVLALIVLFIVVGFLRNRGVNKMTPQQVKELIGQKNVWLIDVRTPAEYKSGHIKGAKNISLQSMQKGIFKPIPDKNAKIIVYCQSGSRSMAAYQLLKKEGYADIHNLGSIMKWPDDLV